MMVNLNRWVVDKMRENNWCFQKKIMVVDFCTERELYMGNTYFEHKSLHKYTTVARSQDGVEIKTRIDLVLVSKDMLCYEQDVRAVRGNRQGLSDHNVVLCKVRLVGAWIMRN